MKGHRLAFLLAGGLALGILGCAAATKVGTELAVASGRLSRDQADSLQKTAVAMEKTFEDLSPEQEHYIGRAVAANLLATYPLREAPALDTYLNTLGQVLAEVSDRPETFNGYRFGLMDTEEINAFAAPGGLILVSRGLLRCCPTEDALAAVLAHEIGHVERAHGLKAIKKGRLTGALTTLATEAGKHYGSEQVKQLSRDFGDSIGDITSTLVNSGYSRDLEREADQSAVRILERAGYDPRGLGQMLQEMERRLKPGSHGFGKTHPSPKDRLAALALPGGAPASQAERDRRFRAALAGL